LEIFARQKVHISLKTKYFVTIRAKVNGIFADELLSFRRGLCLQHTKGRCLPCNFRFDRARLDNEIKLPNSIGAKPIIFAATKIRGQATSLFGQQESRRHRQVSFFLFSQYLFLFRFL
jgi:hypothetical protein